MDKDYWTDPETFRPERFIDSAGKYVKDERVSTVFGFGKVKMVLNYSNLQVFFSQIFTYSFFN